ncbi:hypothetical protein AMJ51_00010 [Microgenomates bacterium DG_75]|nr:MAG: hypothetical protein AMJ51_00010 [Microgenomates bacterium DG_75]
MKIKLKKTSFWITLLLKLFTKDVKEENTAHAESQSKSAPVEHVRSSLGRFNHLILGGNGQK